MLSCNCISVPYIKEIKKSNKSLRQAENVGITSSRKINFRSFWPCFLTKNGKRHWSSKQGCAKDLSFLAQRMPYHRSGDLMEFSVRTYSSINFFLIYFFCRRNKFESIFGISLLKSLMTLVSPKHSL